MRHSREHPHRIDVHAHVIPPKYVEMLTSIGVKGSEGRDFPKWSPKSVLRVMDRNGIDTAILSLSTPGSYFKDDALTPSVWRR